MIDAYEELNFWPNVDMGGDCWLWTGVKHSQGYGSYRYAGKKDYAHRFAWESLNGEIPPGMCVLHHCDTRPCCNPSHLFLGTIRDNALDAQAKGRHTHGEMHGSVKLTEAQVIAIRWYCAQGALRYKVAERFGVSRQTVRDIVIRATWKHI
jgi:hypothetical protein